MNNILNNPNAFRVAANDLFNSYLEYEDHEDTDNDYFQLMADEDIILLLPDHNLEIPFSRPEIMDFENIGVKIPKKKRIY